MNPLGPVIDWIHHHRPANPGRYVMPYLTAVLTLLMVLAIVQAHFASTSSAEIHGALCALRKDVTVRVRISRDFLRDHPEGVPGIPAGAIKVSLAGQERTVRALDGLSC